VRAISTEGRELRARALPDQGSELSFVSEALVQALRLQRRHSVIPLFGVGALKSTTTRGIVRVDLQPHFESRVRFTVEAHILPQITSRLPPVPVKQHPWSHLSNLKLADPQFATPGNIDILLGADIYGYLLQNDVIRGQSEESVAQRTLLGWIISGPTAAKIQPNQRCTLIGMCAADQQLNEVVNQFWIQEIVSPPEGSLLSEDDQTCETHFRKTHSRDATGRLPFKQSANLGASKLRAARMLANLHHKFLQNHEFRQLYTEFLAEYESLGHMQYVGNNVPETSACYYLPHHGALKESSTTTTLRVVFNGSHKTTEGLSLNDCLHAGPKVQQDLDAVLLRWRVFPYVFSSDIEKMYRQILIHSDDRKYQQILLSGDPSQEPATYQLTTVTYGLTCAPFLAIRTLAQLAEDDGKRFPLGAETIRKHMYVDDVFAGADSIALARKRADQVNRLLMAGSFALQKWASNDPNIISHISGTHEAHSTKTLTDETLLRALGLSWDPSRDAFCFLFRTDSVSSPRDRAESRTHTKRSVLSVIARLFDPLGWLAPVIILAKIFLQSLWKVELEWDSPLPAQQASLWEMLLRELQSGVTFTIPRWLGTSQSSVVELHGFSDASRAALSAVVYVRVIEEDMTARVTLLTAKTKVAPLKPVTIPRLELSAAVLLTQLVARVRETLDYKGVPVHMWVDSTVALAWIRGNPSRWKEFVSNRVALIQDLLPGCHWNHVAGCENPADVASRGVSSSELEETTTWWNGPLWLTRPSTSWPIGTPNLPEDVNLEEREKQVLTASLPPLWDLVNRYSSLTQLLRITARVMPASSRFRRRISGDASSAPLTPGQLMKARLFWIKHTQRTFFKSEINLLEKGQPLPRSSHLLRLTPYLDDDGLLRLGGRLRHAALDADAKNQLILPRISPVTSLLIRQAHFQTLHGGAQLTLATLRQQVWIIGGRARVRSAILRCVTCARQRGATLQQRMGQLPALRAKPARPFLHTGVDYAGPFNLKLRRDRSSTTYKGFLVVFVCFTTSAVHLELATTYSTDGFLAAYKRFTGRRGICATLYSDCGTNFVGADKELKRLFSATSKEFGALRSLLAAENTAWHFNPPGAPHFGGKWEAAVKSTKYHLRRVIGGALLTPQEFSSLLIQIECDLNSRPLVALSEDPSDLSVLTPGHFLIGEPLNTLPEPSLMHLPASRLTHWQRTRQTLDHFWQKWSREYLQRHQLVSTWQTPQRQLPLGAVVLIADERYPPSKWPLARVIKVHPGNDGFVRVATLRTAAGTTCRRPITKLCLLPVAEEPIAHPIGESGPGESLTSESDPG